MRSILSIFGPHAHHDASLLDAFLVVLHAILRDCPTYQRNNDAAAHGSRADSGDARRQRTGNQRSLSSPEASGQMRSPLFAGISIGSDDLDATSFSILAHLAGLILSGILLVLGRHPNVFHRAHEGRWFYPRIR